MQLRYRWHGRIDDELDNRFKLVLPPKTKSHGSWLIQQIQHRNELAPRRPRKSTIPTHHRLWERLPMIFSFPRFPYKVTCLACTQVKSSILVWIHKTRPWSSIQLVFHTLIHHLTSNSLRKQIVGSLVGNWLIFSTCTVGRIRLYNLISWPLMRVTV